MLLALGSGLAALAAVIVAFALWAAPVKINSCYPREGPAGSCVVLELGGRIVPDRIKVRYGDRDLPLTGLGERCLGLNIPVDRGSDAVRLFDGDREAGSVVFTVKAPVVTPLHEERATPSGQKQVIRSKEGITVTLPGGFLQRARTVSIARVENAAVYREGPLGAGEVYDISIEGMDQLEGFVEIGIPYDPGKLDKDIPVEANFNPMRWDEKGKRWVDLYYRVDEPSHTVHFLADHLSLMAIGAFALGVAKTGAMVAAVGGTVGEVVERWANDKYLSRNWKVRVLYSDKALRATFPDAEWKAAIAPANLYVADLYDAKYAAAVQDIALILEKAHACYVAAGFPDLTQRSFLGVPYRRYIKVKVDSLFGLAHGELAQETFWDTIHIPTDILKFEFFNPVQADAMNFELAFQFLKSGLAHELFHSVQGQYYGSYLAAFLGTEHKWWKEATAEWAGNDLAKVPYRSGWEKDPPALLTRLGPRFLDHPVNSLGKIAGTCSETGGLEYEYLAAAFVRYLVRERGYNFKSLITEVAEEGRKTDPLVRLRTLVKAGASPGIDDLYADYAAWALAQAQLPVSDFNGPSSTKVAARKSEVLAVDEEKASLRIIQKNRPANGHILVFRVKKGAEKLEPKAKLLAVIAESRPKAYGFEAAEGDIFYILVANASEADRTVELAIEQKKADPKTKAVKWEERAGYALELKKDGTAAVWALKVSSGGLKIDPPKVDDAEGYREYEFTVSADNLPKEVKEVRLAYDFGDKRKKAKGEVKETVCGGSVRIELKYAYEPSPGVKPKDRPIRYDLTVDLLHGKKKLGSATAPVTVAKAEVSIQPPRLLVLDLSKGAKESSDVLAAVARPEGKYRFAWDFGDGKTWDDTRPPGDPSTAKHTFGGLRAGVHFAPKVRLYSQAGTLLAEDTIAIKAEGGGPSGPSAEYDCGWEWNTGKSRIVEHGDRSETLNSTGLRHGPLSQWYEESRNHLMSVTCSKNGKEHGKLTSWHYQADVYFKYLERWYEDGQQNGPETFYYQNGRKQVESNWVKGRQTGAVTYWYENGQLESKGTLRNGKNAGLWKYWNADGTLRKPPIMGAGSKIGGRSA